MRRQPLQGQTGRRLAGALQRGPSERLQQLSPSNRPQQSMGQGIAQGMQGDMQSRMVSQPPMPQVEQSPQQLQFAAPTDIGNQAQMPMDKMFRYPAPQNFPQMPEPSANMGGQYRLSPGMYGSGEQAMQQMYQPYVRQPASPQGQQISPQQAQELRNRMMRM